MLVLRHLLLLLACFASITQQSEVSDGRDGVDGNGPGDFQEIEEAVDDGQEAIDGTPQEAVFLGLTPEEMALRVATMAGNDTSVVNKLIDDGVDVNQPDTNWEETPLHHAARFNNSHLVKLLIDNGASVEAKMGGPFEVQRYFGFVQDLQFLYSTVWLQTFTSC
jgi:hypothetical protein